jgi:transcriptional regulator with XRE-family HTH domain
MPFVTVFGRNLKEARLNAGLSLRALAEKLGITHVFLGEIERGVKQVLPEKRWDDLLKAIPSLKKPDLVDWAERSKTLELDLREESESYQDLSLALARNIRSHSITEKDVAQIMKLLGESYEK